MFHLDFAFSADLPVTPGALSTWGEVVLAPTCLISLAGGGREGFLDAERGFCGCLSHRECLRVNPWRVLCSGGDVSGPLNTVFYSDAEGD